MVFNNKYDELFNVGNVPVSHELDKCVPLQVFTFLLSF